MKGWRASWAAVCLNLESYTVRQLLQTFVNAFGLRRFYYEDLQAKMCVCSDNVFTMQYLFNGTLIDACVLHFDTYYSIPLQYY